MRQMICAVQGFEYPPGKVWRKGQVFEVQDEHVKIFQVAGKASLPPDDHAGAPVLPTVAAPVAAPAAVTAAPKEKRKYKKRATKAEKAAAEKASKAS